jgi:hypothetical protein
MPHELRILVPLAQSSPGTPAARVRRHEAVCSMRRAPSSAAHKQTSTMTTATRRCPELGAAAFAQPPSAPRDFNHRAACTNNAGMALLRGVAALNHFNHGCAPAPQAPRTSAMLKFTSLSFSTARRPSMFVLCSIHVHIITLAVIARRLGPRYLH